MKIALIGATGFVGTAVLAELLSRDHAVTALARNPAKLTAHPRLQTGSLDAYDADAVARAVRGLDAVVSAFNPGWHDHDLYALFMQGSAAIERGVEASGVKRLLVVGGSGSLFVAPGIQLVDTAVFAERAPANIIPGARAARDALTAIRNNTTLEWTFLSPPAVLEPGERTGKYQLGARNCRWRATRWPAFRWLTLRWPWSMKLKRPGTCARVSLLRDLDRD